MSHVHIIRTTRPETIEYAPYYGGYIARVHNGDVVEALSTQHDTTLALLRGLSESQSGSRYAEGKWSVREVVGHMMDAERVFSYRALRFARGDETALASFDENAYVANAKFDLRTLGSLCDEFEGVRRATVLLFSSFDSEEWLRRGVASNNVMSVRGLAWVTAGHELHHLEILRSRYL